MFRSALLRTAVLAIALGALTACDSAEERAQKHYENGMALLQSGDVDRAMVEFRNVFALDESHHDARLAYARAAREMGNISESYANYLRLVEQYPDDVEARLALTEMAILGQNWTEAERHANALIEAKADAAGVAVAKLALDFRQAVIAKDNARAREITAQATEMAKTAPEDRILQRILIEGYSMDQRFDDALAVTERAIAQSPRDAALYRVKAGLLVQKNDLKALEEHLRVTIAQFPEDSETKAALIRLLAQQGEVGRAEEFLRDEIARTEDKTAAHVNLVSFLQQTQGNEAALAELEKAIATYDDKQVFVALKAGILFDTGKRDEAVTLLQSVVEGAEPSQQVDRYRVMLAKMLGGTGNEVGARQLVEQVLAHDPTQVEALKMSASWLIESDRVDDAINALRTALDQAPEDAEAMTLMAQAHQRNGDTQLAQDLLALAVEASGNRAPESIRFARVLIEQKRYGPAEDVLINALRVSPGNQSLLELLAEVYLANEDWPRAEQVAASLKRLDTDAARRSADQVQLQIIARREGRDEAIAYLEQLNSAEGGNTAATIGLIRAKLSEQKGDEALALARELVTSNPDNPRLKTVLASTQFALRDYAGAEQTIREALGDSSDPTMALQLVRVLSAQGRTDDARAAIDEGLAKSPGAGDLLWAKASFLEASNDIDGAIAIYEELYEKNSNSVIVANNLASLLATYRDDEASLERAMTVARRLRGSEAPPLQDTYGWILFRRGELDEALTYLEPASAGLPRDPVVQYHVGRAYEEAGRKEDALAAYRRALDIAPPDDPRAQLQDAKARADKLAAEAGQ